MSKVRNRVDVAVIGGGYYGHTVANEIKTIRPELEIAILEQADHPFALASSSNQGQLHAGYMYSNFPDIARDCIAGVRQFRELFGDAIRDEVTTYYGIHKDSEISQADYEGFCDEVGLKLMPADNLPSAFVGGSVTSVFETTEKAFSNSKLQEIIAHDLEVHGVRLVTSFEVGTVQQQSSGLVVYSTDGREVHAGAVFNATFAGSNAIHARSNIPKLPLEHAVFLHFCIRLPEQYRDKGLIVVRGQFAALTPAEQAQAATHILASGQHRVVSKATVDAPDASVGEEEVTTRYSQAVREARIYMPLLDEAVFVGHIIGTRSNYIDPDSGLAASKAQVLRNYGGLHNYHIVFGGKVSCLTEIIDPIRDIASTLR